MGLSGLYHLLWHKGETMRHFIIEESRLAQIIKYLEQFPMSQIKGVVFELTNLPEIPKEVLAQQPPRHTDD